MKFSERITQFVQLTAITIALGMLTVGGYAQSIPFEVNEQEREVAFFIEEIGL